VAERTDMKHEPPPKPDKPERGRDFAELLMETTELQMQILRQVRRYALLIYSMALFHIVAMATSVVLIQYLLNHATK
jgi:hypothetical protein